MRIVSRFAAVALAAVVGLTPTLASAQPRQWYPHGGAAGGPVQRGPAIGGPGMGGPVYHGSPPGVSPRWNGGGRRDYDGRRGDYRHYRHGYGYRGDRDYGWDPGAAAAAGIIGLAVGSMVAGSASGNRHVQRCLNRYRTYDPDTDTFVGNDGRRHYCRL